MTRHKTSTSPPIGIDLGTWKCCVAVVREGKVEIIENERGSKTTPSYVAFTETERLVGEDAKDQVALNPTNTIFGVKRIIGRSFDDQSLQRDMKFWPFTVTPDAHERPRIPVQYRVQNRMLTPELVSPMMLEKMKRIAESHLGCEVRDAVISVPAYFNNGQRQATKDAGAIAGLNVLGLINEPTAAALAYRDNKARVEPHNVLIFDLGGGTFDVAVIRVDESGVEVKGVCGDAEFGGNEMDVLLMKRFEEEFLKKHGKLVLQDKKGTERLRTASEMAKKALTFLPNTNVQVDSLIGDIDFSTSIRRIDFEQLYYTDVKEKIEAVIKNVFQQTKIQSSDIDEVVLVGGTSRIPKIQNTLVKIFNGKALNKTVNPDEAVAHGAALQAAFLAGDSELEEVCISDKFQAAPSSEMKRMEGRITNCRDFSWERFYGPFYSMQDEYEKYDGEFEYLFSNETRIPEMGGLTEPEIQQLTAEVRQFTQDDLELQEGMAALSDLEAFCFQTRASAISNSLRQMLGQDEVKAIGDRCEEMICWLDDNDSATKSEYQRMKREFGGYILAAMQNVDIKEEELCNAEKEWLKQISMVGDKQPLREAKKQTHLISQPWQANSFQATPNFPQPGQDNYFRSTPKSPLQEQANSFQSTPKSPIQEQANSFQSTPKFPQQGQANLFPSTSKSPLQEQANLFASTPMSPQQEQVNLSQSKPKSPLQEQANSFQSTPKFPQQGQANLFPSTSKSPLHEQANLFPSTPKSPLQEQANSFLSTPKFPQQGQANSFPSTSTFPQQGQANSSQSTPMSPQQEQVNLSQSKPKSPLQKQANSFLSTPKFLQQGQANSLPSTSKFPQQEQATSFQSTPMSPQQEQAISFQSTLESPLQEQANSFLSTPKSPQQGRANLFPSTSKSPLQERANSFQSTPKSSLQEQANSFLSTPKSPQQGRANLFPSTPMSPQHEESNLLQSRSPPQRQVHRPESLPLQSVNDPKLSVLDEYKPKYASDSQNNRITLHENLVESTEESSQVARNVIEPFSRDRQKPRPQDFDSELFSLQSSQSNNMDSFTPIIQQDASNSISPRGLDPGICSPSVAIVSQSEVEPIETFIGSTFSSEHYSCSGNVSPHSPLSSSSKVSFELSTTSLLIDSSPIMPDKVLRNSVDIVRPGQQKLPSGDFNDEHLKPASSSRSETIPDTRDVPVLENINSKQGFAATEGQRAAHTFLGGDLDRGGDDDRTAIGREGTDQMNDKNLQETTRISLWSQPSSILYAKDENTICPQQQDLDTIIKSLSMPKTQPNKIDNSNDVLIPKRAPAHRHPLLMTRDSKSSWTAVQSRCITPTAIPNDPDVELSPNTRSNLDKFSVLSPHPHRTKLPNTALSSGTMPYAMSYLGRLRNYYGESLYSTQPQRVHSNWTDNPQQRPCASEGVPQSVDHCSVRPSDRRPPGLSQSQLLHKTMGHIPAQQPERHFNRNKERQVRSNQGHTLEHGMSAMHQQHQSCEGIPGYTRIYKGREINSGNYAHRSYPPKVSS